jgi:hypothetical protein
MHPLAASLERSPELFPHSLNSEANTATLVRLSEADYAAASFLDDRVLTRQTIARPVALPELQAAVADTRLEERCDFIFHIGHVGSTLLSRLLGSHPALFALREPAILRTLAQTRAAAGPGISGDAKFEGHLSCFLKLFSRTFRPEQRANIKATSFVSELAAEILARPSAPKAILLFVPAEIYLATILGGPNSRQEARILADRRLKRLHHRIGEVRWQLADLCEGEIIAISWACEMSALAAASDSAGDRALWLNFERFLDEPAHALGSGLRHLGIEASADEITSMISGPEMRRYSKAPEYAYDAALRREVLDQARRQDSSEISRGMTWLERASATVPMIQQTLAIS